MERPVIKNMDELKNMCQPIADFLHENCNPYTEIHISNEMISVTTVECGIPIKRKDGQS